MKIAATGLNYGIIGHNQKINKKVIQEKAFVQNNTVALNNTTNQYLINFKGNFNDEVKLNRAVIQEDKQTILELAENDNISQECLDKQTFIAATLVPEVISSLQNFKNFNINCTDEFGQTPLIKMVGAGFFEDVISPIIKNPKTNVNIQDEQGNTALMHACNSIYTRLDSIVELFERKDLDFTIRNFQNKTAIQIAKERSRLDFVRYMYNKEKEIITEKINNSKNVSEKEKLQRELQLLNLDIFPIKL